MYKYMIMGLCMMSIMSIAPAGWQDELNRAIEIVGGDSEAPGDNLLGAQLDNAEIVKGLKEALAQGTTRAINQLGQTDGFWADQAVKIYAPGELKRVGKSLRKMGQGAMVDEFEQSLNRAAEQAVPEAADIIGDAIRNMTFADAQAILQGGDQSATAFFRRTTEQQLYDRFYPMVQNATNQTGVTQYYKSLMGEAGWLASLVNLDADALDQHVTQKTLDGLFSLIGQEEKNIRDNPAARGTDILREVFGAQ